jgi:hypothetical protein
MVMGGSGGGGSGAAPGAGGALSVPLGAPYNDFFLFTYPGGTAASGATPAGAGFSGAVMRNFIMNYGGQGGGGAAITVQDEGSTLTTSLTSLNFTGSVVATNVGGDVTVNVTGGGGGSFTGGTITGATQITNANVSTTNLTGALTVTGGVGITGNIYTAGRVGYTSSSSGPSVVYTYYNSSTGSIDTVFG